MQLPATSESISPGEGRSSAHRSCQPKPWHSWNTQQLLEWSQQGKKTPSLTCISLHHSPPDITLIMSVKPLYLLINLLIPFKRKSAPGVHQAGIRSKLPNNQSNNEANLTFLLQQSQPQSIFKSLQGSQQGNRLGKSTMWELRIAVWPSANSRMAKPVWQQHHF